MIPTWRWVFVFFLAWVCWSVAFSLDHFATWKSRKPLFLRLAPMAGRRGTKVLREVSCPGCPQELHREEQ